MNISEWPIAIFDNITMPQMQIASKIDHIDVFFGVYIFVVWTDITEITI